VAKFKEELREAVRDLIHSVRLRDGTSPMAMNVRDYYPLPDGRIVLHEWGMGGESFSLVPALPNEEGSCA
jgi:hypothetical protein